MTLFNLEAIITKLTGKVIVGIFTSFLTGTMNAPAATAAKRRDLMGQGAKSELSRGRARDCSWPRLGRRRGDVVQLATLKHRAPAARQRPGPRRRLDP